MQIQRLVYDSDEARFLWEQNMKEPWSDYDLADKFVQKNEQGQIIGGFAVYYDESDGVCGNFISGWSVRKNPSVLQVIQQVADLLGEVYIKTDKRQMKIFSYKIGKLVKNAGRFSYFIVKGKQNV